MKAARRHRKLVVAAVAVAVAVASAGALLAATGPPYTVVADAGDALPYDADVYQVRIADSATIYVESDGASKTDALTATPLIAAGTMAFTTWWLIAGLGSNLRRRRFWLIAGFGLTFLALDELTGLHETVGHTLASVTELPGIDRPDDAVFSLYALPAIAAAVHFRDVLFESPKAAALLGLGAALFPLASMADYMSLSAEELLEIAAAVVMLAGIVTLAAGTLRTARAALAAGPNGDRAGLRLGAAPSLPAREQVPDQRHAGGARRRLQVPQR
jgi:hypothetical protein